MKDRANTRLYSASYPGIFLAGNRLIWNGNECQLKETVFETPVGELSLEKVRTLFESNIFIPPNLWPKIRFEYLDNNVDNNDCNNVVMMFPPGGLEMESKPGYYYIPGFTRYVVNVKGDVYNWKMNLQMSPYLAEVGYWMFGMTNDHGKRTIIGTHRVLALAFLQFVKSVRKLDVNHKNGIKTDNDLENLEWSTRSQNCNHAYETGLRDENIIVEVKSIYTGEVVLFYSMNEAARQMSVCVETISNRSNSNGQVVYAPGVLVRRRDCGIQWKDLTATDFDLFGIGKVSRIVLTSDTIEVTADTYHNAAAITGIDSNTIWWRFHNWQQPISLGKFTGKFESFERDCKSLFAVMRGSNIS